MCLYRNTTPADQIIPLSHSTTCTGTFSKAIVNQRGPGKTNGGGVGSSSWSHYATRPHTRSSTMGITTPDTNTSAKADTNASTTTSSAATNNAISTSTSGSVDTSATEITAAVGTKMPHRFMGGSGLLVSALALGSWNVYNDTFGVDQVYDIATRAFAHGVNFFDNAEGYGAGMAETVLGQVVHRGIKNGVWSREDLVLTTKIFLGTEQGPNNMGLSRKHIIEGTRASLKRMQLDYVDVLFCHRSEPYTPIEEIVRAMNFCIEKGWAFYWGTSDWSSHDIMQACEIAERLKLIRPVIDQAKYSIFDRYTVEHDYELLYQKYDFGLSIFSPMSVGILTGKYADGVKPGMRLSHPLYKTMIPDLAQRIEKAKDLHIFAEQELQCTLPQLALAWTVSNPRCSNVLVGVSSVKQVDENMKALQVMTKLTPEVRARIDEIIDYKPELPVQDSFPLLRSKYL